MLLKLKLFYKGGTPIMHAMTAFQSQHLNLLYRTTQTFNSSLELDTVLDTVMDEVIALTGAERGFLLLQEEGGQPQFRSARAIDNRTIGDPTFQVSRSIILNVISSGDSQLTSDAMQDKNLQSAASVVSLNLRSILCVPLKLKERIIGAIYVDNRLVTGIFTRDHLQLIEVVAVNAAVAIENARLYLVAVEKGRIERELQLAHAVQSRLVPQTVPEVAGWEFSADWLPAREVAGDYYDFIELENGRIGIVIADVSGKGMAAALMMAVSRSLVRASVAAAESPAEGIQVANDLICRDAADGMFVTLFYAELDLNSGEMLWVNGGHNPPICRRANGDLIHLPTAGPVLGILEDFEYPQQSLQIYQGDTLVFFTDGVTEAPDPHDKPFGDTALEAIVQSDAEEGAEGLLIAIQEALVEHGDSAEPFDDVTMVIIQREP